MLGQTPRAKKGMCVTRSLAGKRQKNQSPFRGTTGFFFLPNLRLFICI